MKLTSDDPPWRVKLKKYCVDMKEFASKNKETIREQSEKLLEKADAPVRLTKYWHTFVERKTCIVKALAGCSDDVGRVFEQAPQLNNMDLVFIIPWYFIQDFSKQQNKK